MKLNPRQIDLLTEIINVGIGRSAGILNKIVSSRVKLHVPEIQLIHLDELKGFMTTQEDGRLSLVSMGFRGDLSGKAALVFSSDDARKIVDLITGKNYEQLEMDQLRASALNEVGNIVLNSLVGTLGNLLKVRFRYRIPAFAELERNELVSNAHSGAEYLILANTHFLIRNHDIDGSFMLFFEVGSLDAFIEFLDRQISG